ncbi:MAG: hypothetical protein RBR71_12170 [Gudongella sp.]|nr:hypothetical protein [Gudongella sp.]
MTAAITYETILLAVTRVMGWSYLDPNEKIAITKKDFVAALIMTRTTSIRSAKEWWSVLQDLEFLTPCNKVACYVNLPKIFAHLRIPGVKWQNVIVPEDAEVVE